MYSLERTLRAIQVTRSKSSSLKRLWNTLTSPNYLDVKEKNYILPVNHTLVFELSGPFSFLLENLTAYTNHSLQLAYATVKPGNITQLRNRGTPIDG